MSARDGVVENKSEGWGSGEWERGMGEWRVRARDGEMENESKGWGNGE